MLKNNVHGFTIAELANELDVSTKTIQRAEERNHNTAVLFDKLGMAEYQAIELFVRYKI